MTRISGVWGGRGKRGRGGGGRGEGEPLVLRQRLSLVLGKVLGIRINYGYYDYD